MSKTFRGVGKYDPPTNHHSPNHSAQRPSQAIQYWQCEECDQAIPEYADLVNHHHSTACSLHTTNVQPATEWLTSSKGLVN